MGSSRDPQQPTDYLVSISALRLPDGQATTVDLKKNSEGLMVSDYYRRRNSKSKVKLRGKSASDVAADLPASPGGASTSPGA